MRAPNLFVRPLSEEERVRQEAGLRSKDVVVLRRCQLLLASARGEQASAIAPALRCDSQTVRNAITAFARSGLAVLIPGKRGPRRPAPSAMQRPGSGCAPCCARARASSARRPASGCWSWLLRSASPRASPPSRSPPRRSAPPASDWGRLEAGQALDHQPRPRGPAKKGVATV